MFVLAFKWLRWTRQKSLGLPSGQTALGGSFILIQFQGDPMNHFDMGLSLELFFVVSLTVAVAVAATDTVVVVDKLSATRISGANDNKPSATRISGANDDV